MLSVVITALLINGHSKFSMKENIREKTAAKALALSNIYMLLT
jgi:hypothetical protein